MVTSFMWVTNETMDQAADRLERECEREYDASKAHTARLLRKLSRERVYRKRK